MSGWPFSTTSSTSMPTTKARGGQDDLAPHNHRSNVSPSSLYPSLDDKEKSDAGSSSIVGSTSSPKRPKGWVHFVAGGIGGMCGAIVTSPLDVVKTRLQSDMYKNQRSVSRTMVSSSVANHGGKAGKGFLQSTHRLAYHFVETGQLLRQISIQEGPKALFRGLGPTLVGVIPARSINFYTYGNGKLLIAENLNGGRENPAVHLCAAIIAGLTTATATNPIWVVKTRLQLHQHQGERRVRPSSDLRRTPSVQGNGRPGIIASSPLERSHLASSQQLSGVKKSGFKTESSPVSRSAVYSSNEPNRTFFRSQPRPMKPGLSSLEMTLKILRTEGVKGLYRGLSASYLGAAEGTIQWVLYEQFKRFAGSSPSQQQQQQQQYSSAPDTSDSTLRRWLGTVSSAGTAKMIASLITYPHEVLRTRLRQQPLPGERQKYIGLLQTARLVLKEEGLVSFYGGLSAHLLRVVPNAAIMFVVYETMLGMNT